MLQANVRVSMGLTVSRPMALKLIVSHRNRYFFTVSHEKCRLILTTNKFQRFFKSHYSADLQGCLAPEETLNWKNQFPCS